MVDDYRDRGVGFVAISPNDPDAVSLAELGYSDMGDDLEDMKIRAKDRKYNFPYLYDGDTQKASIAYGPAATPHVFIFDSERKLQYTGRIDDTENPYIQPEQQDMINALEALLNEKPVPVQKTKTFGCSVKWAWKDEWTKKLLEDWKKAPVDLADMDAAGIQDLVRNQSDKLRLINVWATWCGPCVIEFPEFITIDRMYRGRDFEFISVSADKPNRKEKALEFLKKSEAANKNYIFSGDNAYDLIEAVDKEWQGALPFTMLIAPGGEVLFKTQGTIEPFSLKKKIVNYLGRYYADDK
jgi:thiol-disulfide isomerase/thioredoxin